MLAEKTLKSLNEADIVAGKHRSKVQIKTSVSFKAAGCNRPGRINLDVYNNEFITMWGLQRQIPCSIIAGLTGKAGSLVDGEWWKLLTGAWFSSSTPSFLAYRSENVEFGLKIGKSPESGKQSP